MTTKHRKNPPRRKPKDQLIREYRKSLEAKPVSETFETEEEPDIDSTGYRPKEEKITLPPAEKKNIINWKKMKKIALIVGAIAATITILVFFGKGIYKIASIDSSVQYLEKRMDKMEERFDKYIYEKRKR